jgi:hypothetical protein
LGRTPIIAFVGDQRQASSPSAYGLLVVSPVRPFAAVPHVHDVAVMIDRERAGREASPSAGVIDSQSVKAPSAKERGFCAAKKVVGRKRHIAVDTDGRLLTVNLTTADISDSAGAQTILDAIRQRWPWLKHLFADGL